MYFVSALLYFSSLWRQAPHRQVNATSKPTFVLLLCSTLTRSCRSPAAQLPVPPQPSLYVRHTNWCQWQASKQAPRERKNSGELRPCEATLASFVLLKERAGWDAARANPTGHFKEEWRRPPTRCGWQHGGDSDRSETCGTHDRCHVLIPL